MKRTTHMEKGIKNKAQKKNIWNLVFNLTSRGEQEGRGAEGLTFDREGHKIDSRFPLERVKVTN